MLEDQHELVIDLLARDSLPPSESRAAKFACPRARRFGPRAAFPADIAVRSIRQDRARDNAEEMIGAWRERGLVAEPRERPDQRKQVSAIDVGPCYARGLSAGEEPCACRAHRDARSMECGLGVFDGGHHQRHNAPILMCARDAVA